MRGSNDCLFIFGLDFQLCIANIVVVLLQRQIKSLCFVFFKLDTVFLNVKGSIIIPVGVSRGCGWLLYMTHPDGDSGPLHITNGHFLSHDGSGCGSLVPPRTR